MPDRSRDHADHDVQELQIHDGDVQDKGSGGGEGESGGIERGQRGVGSIRGGAGDGDLQGVGGERGENAPFLYYE